jgi:GrpB-like predicted nucleotidyltransferase (UPF0157 family)
MESGKREQYNRGNTVAPKIGLSYDNDKLPYFCIENFHRSILSIFPKTNVFSHRKPLSTFNFQLSTTMLLHPYSPHWPQQFAAIQALLAAALAPLRVHIEHIGSTAIPGLAAKPIIDIDIIYNETADFAAIETALAGLGYRHHGNQGIEGREVFKRMGNGHAVLDTIPHHLYACLPTAAELRRHLLFRDYLRQHPVARDYYQRLKETIAAEAGQDRKRYAELKELKAGAFVGFVVELAAKEVDR